MFDFHMHTLVSFDGRCTAEQMLAAAEKAGLKEICFTDHMDEIPLKTEQTQAFDLDAYSAAYDHLTHADVKIRRGMEFGMLPDNKETLANCLRCRPYDFVIGSVHFAKDLDIYREEFWVDRTIDQAERGVLEDTLACVQHHDDFDVLGHLTYISKARANPIKRPVSYEMHRDIIDAILQELARKDKGLEINTSGVDRCGTYLPSLDYLRRFKELGGKIVTVGSDSHDVGRVGQYCFDACAAVQEIFGHVCTFENRQPIFHKF